MSPTIWTRCGGKSKLKTLSVIAWRMVEYQYKVSTRKLVDTLQEQELLEKLLEGAKPPRRTGPEWKHLHFLLWTPFRYPPLKYGSRFGSIHQPGLWYGSLDTRTMLAEKSYYRLLFLNHTEATPTMEADLTAYQIPLRSNHAVDLTKPPFSKFTSKISDKITYEQSQPLGDSMREAGVEFFKYVSARDPKGGHNVGVFSPKAFAAKSPSESHYQTWHCSATRESVEFTLMELSGSDSVVFSRRDFEVEGVLFRR